MAGKLILCATPIGNLEDMTYRAVRTLQEADVIAAEDTRNSMRLLNHFDIHTPMTSYHANNRYDKARVLVGRMMAGEQVALITDAGMPGISDPGEELVQMAIEAGIEVTAVPGACACVTGLCISGLPTRRFCFEAFLPMDKKERAQILEELRDESRTIVLYEAPHRLRRTLDQLCETLGDRRAAACRELTKIHETVMTSSLYRLRDYYAENEPRGEFVLVIAGEDACERREREQAQWQDLSVPEHLQMYLDQGLEKKEAMKAVARDRGVGKRDIYKVLMQDNL